MEEGTIAAAAALSGVIALPSEGRRAIIDVDGWNAAAMTFAVALEGGVAVGSHSDLYDEGGTEVSIPSFTGARAIELPPEVLAAASVVIRSGTTATPVNQTSARAIKIRES